MHRTNKLNSAFAEKAAEFVRYGFAGTRPGPSGTKPPSREQIAEAAYFRAKARHFRPGGELEDWLAAERELNSASSNTRRV
jgi:hypothetical protein